MFGNRAHAAGIVGLGCPGYDCAAAGCPSDGNCMAMASMSGSGGIALSLLLGTMNRGGLGGVRSVGPLLGSGAISIVTLSLLNCPGNRGGGPAVRGINLARMPMAGGDAVGEVAPTLMMSASTVWAGLGGTVSMLGGSARGTMFGSGRSGIPDCDFGPGN